MPLVVRHAGLRKRMANALKFKAHLRLIGILIIRAPHLRTQTPARIALPPKPQRLLFSIRPYAVSLSWQFHASPSRAKALNRSQERSKVTDYFFFGGVLLTRLQSYFNAP